MSYYIRERFKLIHKKNKISGHEWIEHGPTTGYFVVGPFGVVSTHRVEQRAEQARDEWNAYENAIKRFEEQRQ